jgi:hypothetical protein
MILRVAQDGVYLDQMNECHVLMKNPKLYDIIIIIIIIIIIMRLTQPRIQWVLGLFPRG